MSADTHSNRIVRRFRTEIEALRLALRLVSDPISALHFHRLLLARRGFAEPGSNGDLVTVRLRPLAGAAVKLRQGSADVQTIIDVLVDREHLPPPLSRPPALILDLGANVGLTMAHFATLYPSAKIVGAELDPSNAQLARQNLQPWNDRCDLIPAGVWVTDGKVPYVQREGREVSHAIADESVATATADSISMTSLLATIGVSGDVDYVKMDIEGAEREVLKDGQSWATQVRAIKVEVHPPYSVNECQSDLGYLGFETYAEHRRCAYVVGTRPTRKRH